MYNSDSPSLDGKWNARRKCSTFNPPSLIFGSYTSPKFAIFQEDVKLKRKVGNEWVDIIMCSNKKVSF